MGLSRTSDAATEPVTLAEAKLHCRYEETDEDDRITSYIKAARVYAEKFTNKAFITQTWEWKMDGFPSGPELFVPHPPLVSVSSISYNDTNGDAQTLATSVYDVDTYSVPGRIALAYNQSWPDTRDEIDAVTVTYVAGYGAASAVPETLKQAILLIVGHWFEVREDIAVGVVASKVPRAADELLWMERNMELA